MSVTTLINPVNYKRQYKGSMDSDQIFATAEEMDAYLSSPIRTAGMLVSCLAPERENFIYRLNNAETAWVGFPLSPTNPINITNVTNETSVIINHSLKKQPDVRIFNEDNEQIEGQVIVNSADPLNVVNIELNIPLTGYIVIS